MWRWRSRSGASLVITIGAFLVSPLAALLPAGGLAVASVMTLYYMARVANARVGAGYAVRHVLLAIALSPLLMLGVLVVPYLIRSDLLNWESHQ